MSTAKRRCIQPTHRVWFGNLNQDLWWHIASFIELNECRLTLCTCKTLSEKHAKSRFPVFYPPSAIEARIKYMRTLAGFGYMEDFVSRSLKLLTDPRIWSLDRKTSYLFDMFSSHAALLNRAYALGFKPRRCREIAQKVYGDLHPDIIEYFSVHLLRLQSISSNLMKPFDIEEVSKLIHSISRLPLGSIENSCRYLIFGILNSSTVSRNFDVVDPSDLPCSLETHLLFRLFHSDSLTKLIQFGEQFENGNFDSGFLSMIVEILPCLYRRDLKVRKLVSVAPFSRLLGSPLIMSKSSREQMVLNTKTVYPPHRREKMLDFVMNTVLLGHSQVRTIVLKLIHENYFGVDDCDFDEDFCNSGGQILSRVLEYAHLKGILTTQVLNGIEYIRNHTFCCHVTRILMRLGCVSSIYDNLSLECFESSIRSGYCSDHYLQSQVYSDLKSSWLGFALPSLPLKILENSCKETSDLSTQFSRGVFK